MHVLHSTAMTLQSCTLHRDAMGASSINPSHHTMHMRLAFSQPCCLARRNVARNAIKTRATAENTASIKDRPDWTGQSSLSTAVNFITRIPIVKQAAKSLFKNSMAKQGVDWDSFIYALDAVRPELEAIKQHMEDPCIQYPDYYLKDFHSYEEGNLNWLAASEVEPATLATAWRAYKDPALNPYQANVKLRGSTVDAIKAYQTQHGCRPAQDVLDVGCSIGMSTMPLAQAWPRASVTGLDLSPYFLAVAEYRRQQDPNAQRVRYVHARAEQTPFADASFDLVAVQFVVHECTAQAITDILQEAHRLLREGGTLVVVDINPKSPVIQGLPPLIFTLMKSTEPNMDEYVSVDLQQVLLEEIGFQALGTADVDARHGAVLARKGASTE